MNLHNNKWLIYGIYNPKRADIVTHLSLLRNSIDDYSTSYDNIVVLGDFNSGPSDDPLDEFCNLYNMKNLITVPTCFKSLESLSCIDLIITNRPRSFMDSMAFETGVSDFIN